MKITKFEQSGVIFETNGGFRLALDIGKYTPLEKLAGVTADAVIVSHIHGDHFSLDQIKKLSPKKLYLGSECKEALGRAKFPFEIVEIKAGDHIDTGGIVVDIFSVDHGPNASPSLRDNFGFLITVDGEKIYFAGEMFYESGIEVKNLEVDYAFFPIGTFYTFGPNEAFNFAKKFKKIGKIILMHYEKTPETRNQFLKLSEGHFVVE
ncbi:MAG: MBL fold metallo-hydrolase [Candidatus Nomurabacteria bacterium]|nr:MBL fold metallo-hydrolase [Candidatus Nomurabacteria bacterium]